MLWENYLGRPQKHWEFWVDRGGTFTDCLGRSVKGELVYTKILSSPDAPLVAIRKLLGLKEKSPIPPCEIRMGTTLATNALLERKGQRHALLITQGFRDSLEIGTQQRPDLFDLKIQKSPVLYDRVVEVEERIDANGKVVQPLNFKKLKTELTPLRQEGINNVAIVLLHGSSFPGHEKTVAELVRSMGFEHISCSHEVCPEVGLTARGDTTTVDAYLTPLLVQYVRSLRSGDSGIRLKMMQSNGGLVDAGMLRGHNAILSGPAAGVVACSRIAEWFGHDKVIGFDMGGTSTDISCYEGQFERSYETTAAGVRIKAPVIKIHTVAAGGGSICRYVAGRLTVGPQSAGSDPGPLCYALKDEQGQPTARDLTVTDVNLFLGRIMPDNFPLPLDASRIKEKLTEISEACRRDQQKLDESAIAEGFLDVINLKMAQGIKEISVAQGKDVREYVLFCFGGAGGQHACAVARYLGIKKIFLHPFGGVLSAYGIGLAETAWDGSAPVPCWPLNDQALAKIQHHFRQLMHKGQEVMKKQGFSPDSVSFVRKLDMRYEGTEAPLTMTEPADGDFVREFTEQHRQLYGYVRENRSIEILQCRVEAKTASDVPAPGKRRQPRGRSPVAPFKQTEMTFQGRKLPAPVYWRPSLPNGFRLKGSALVMEDIGTIVVEPDFELTVDEYGNILLKYLSGQKASGQAWLKKECDPVSLEIFNHLFMSVAEQMGRVLQRTAVSTNIKERLDFSCALFDRDGYLVANAPHIPVHLGAMGETVRALKAACGQMKAGDVFVTNNPFNGGTHLPDITVVTPVFTDPRQRQPVFFVASRAHHADIGGITPGSMPPFSRVIDEEGVLIDNVKLIDQGIFQEEVFNDLFRAGIYPARDPDDNLADLQAQMAANQMGVKLMKEVVGHYALKTVQSYMVHVRDNAAKQVREAITRIPNGRYEFEDYLDSGVRMAVTIDIRKDQAVIDFAGTAPETNNNLNAPRAVVHAAVLYFLRCLVNERIPLNDGCLNPIEIRIPEKCLLNPSAGHAVVGGNVETSQRIVDILFGALKMAAASQGTMNNVTFGDDTFGYYETIAGGAGAAEGYNGASAVHTHMTNTRITDPEVLESRYPVQLLEFTIRRESGGSGRWTGGNGVVRVFKFLKDLDVALLTQRRTYAPFGLKGGGAGRRGENIRRLVNGKHVPLGGLASYKAKAGELLIIRTPGGGGYGLHR